MEDEISTNDNEYQPGSQKKFFYSDQIEATTVPNSTLLNSDNMYQDSDNYSYTRMALETSMLTYIYTCKDLGFHAATKILVC